MDLKEAIIGRKSIRKYKSEDINIEKIKEIISLAINAPSAGNSQNWYFLIIKNKNILDEMKNKVDFMYKELTDKEPPSYYTFFPEAPVVIAVIQKPYAGSIDNVLELNNPERNYTRKFIVNPALQGVSSVITHILLIAHNAGYGTCWMTGPLIAKPELEELLGIKSPDNLVALIPVGVPVERKSKSIRKDVNEVIKVID